MLERVFPQLEQANRGELPKRWRTRAGALSNLIHVSAEELVALNTAVELMRREVMAEPLARLETLSSKLKAMIHPDAARRIGPDLEILAEAKGLALRPGPRQTAAPDIVSARRHAILACKRVQLHYRSRGSGVLSRTLVCPYGFLYGNRHYLVADSLNPEARGFRLFSLANIEKVQTTGRPFTRRQGFLLQKFAERSFGVFQEGPQHLAAETPQPTTPVGDLKNALRKYLGWSKGSGGAADLLGICTLAEMPATVKTVLAAMKDIVQPPAAPPPGAAS
jgi:predicted DNA-binding transcriptional regulator YafY